MTTGENVGSLKARKTKRIFLLVIFVAVIRNGGTPVDARQGRARASETLAPTLRDLRENSAISTGKVMRITIGASIIPPTTTMASGFCTCEPIPVESAAGSNPTPAMTQVINTGRI